MKHTVLISTVSLFFSFLAAPAFAQVYRCSHAGSGAVEYINNGKEAQSRGCKVMEGGNVTVVQGGMPASAQPKTPVRVAAAAPSASGSAEQKARDSDSRAILESELRKAEIKLVDQQKEFNNGEPEKQGIEGRNYQRYLDRVAELKDGIIRNQSDIAGLKREIGRLPAATQLN